MAGRLLPVPGAVSASAQAAASRPAPHPVAAGRPRGLGSPQRPAGGGTAMADGHVFAGAVRWPGGASMEAPPDTLGGVFRLAVGGTEWEHVTRGLPAECHVPCLTVDPHDGSRIYAGTQEGPYLSTDGGTSWRRLDFP